MVDSFVRNEICFDIVCLTFLVISQSLAYFADIYEVGPSKLCSVILVG